MVVARGRLAAEGRQPDLLRAAGRLAEASSGVLLAKVQLALASGDDLRIEIEAFSVGSPGGCADFGFPGAAGPRDDECCACSAPAGTLATALLGLGVTLTAVALGRAPGPSPRRIRMAQPAKAPRFQQGEAAALRPFDPAGIRDVFRFADGPPPAAHEEAATARVDGERAAAPAGDRASSAWCGGLAA